MLVRRSGTLVIEIERERESPYSFEEVKEFWTVETLHPKSCCWAQGIEGWKPLDQIVQLKLEPTSYWYSSTQ